MSLLTGLSNHMVGKLLQCGLSEPSLYVYNPFEQSAYIPPSGTTPWPIEYLVTAFHKKHVFAPRHVPNSASISRFISQWDNRTRWRLWFDRQRGDSEQMGEYGFMRTRKDAKPCPMVFDDETEHFLSSTCKLVHDTCLTASSKTHGRRQCFTTPRIVQFALESMVAQGIRALPTDKDGGFALLDNDGYNRAMANILETPQYSLVKLHSDDMIDLFESYKDAAIAISVDKPQFRRALMADSSSLGGMVAKLQMTCKTHKPQREVSCRALHAYNGCPMAPGMRWIMSCLKPGLLKLPHLIIDSNDFMYKTRNLKLPSTCRFLKFDIKDYYMTGSHADLVKLSSLLVEQTHREDFSLLTEAVLTSQYICSSSSSSHSSSSSSSSGKTYKVRSGAGMGMLASGHIADASFYSLVEKTFVLLASTRRKYGLFFYCRFKDDIFTIFDAGNGLDGIREFLNEFKKRSKPFVINMDAVSRHGCQMLDLVVSVGPKNSPVFSLFTKPTNIWHPLSPESCHHSSIHLHWPVCQYKRIKARFSCQSEGVRAAGLFSRVYAEATGGVKICDQQPEPSRSVPTSWFVIPFDFVLGGSRVQQALSNVIVPVCIGAFERVKVSWTLGNKHLMHILRSRHC